MKSIVRILKDYGYHGYLFDEVNSTSRFLSETLKNKKTSKLFCVAKKQTSGYGQRGRHWLSKEQDLTFSFGVPFTREFEGILVLGIALALALRKILSKFHDEELMVKWPNDIYSTKGKVAGILTEVIKSFNGDNFLVIGIGINVSSSRSDLNIKSDYVFDLSMESVLTELLPIIDGIYCLYQTDEVSYSKEWAANDFFNIGDKLEIIHDKSISQGYYLGLSKRFMPLIEKDGITIEYRFGNVSFKRVTK